jgi:signal transduction histidine kinase
VLVAEVRAQAGEALGTLRDLARGIYPPTLADHGIAAALEAHLAKTRAAVSLEADPLAARQRYPSEVEAAVYFCVLEALQNCAKHAPRAAVRVRLDAEPDRLRFVVSDDGPGFEPASTRLGIGLQGMADRVAALGGSLDICSAPGQGTTIAGLLPIGQGRPAAHEALASSSSTSSR